MRSTREHIIYVIVRTCFRDYTASVYIILNRRKAASPLCESITLDRIGLSSYFSCISFLQYIIIPVNIILIRSIQTMSRCSSSSAGRGVIDLVEPFTICATCTHYNMFSVYIIHTHNNKILCRKTMFSLHI